MEKTFRYSRKERKVNNKKLYVSTHGNEVLMMVPHSTRVMWLLRIKNP